MEPFVIGIAGVSCGGKTSLAEAVARRLSANGQALLVGVDSYYRDLSPLPTAERAAIDFDDPAAIDFGELVRDMGRLLAGDGISIPRYLYDTHTRAPRHEWSAARLDPRAPGRPTLVVEGLHALFDPRLRRLYDLAVFVDAPPELCLERRLRRDLRERGRTEAEVRDRFERHVLPALKRFVIPAREHADLVLDGARPTAELAAALIARVAT